MSEAAVSYAALILADAELEISKDNLLSLTKAAGASVDSIWAEIFSKSLQGQNLKDLLLSFGAAGSAAPAAGASAAAVSTEAAAAEEVEEEKEESDDDMGFGLFD
ncbi:unnamed protein product [Kuraishia capsulata CBS 1993]|uniref:Uncharacterized protein n=1 Tax=Kuraishia capsulata CBS 1993 TaxID=1382522 RepID=W6MVL8_9ASCO|nr:uncharacterized protein KUCA_T00002347001 [Kuraishia capsulata CBS 1993]CDK26375.1 unnamed protein product [Kuraishia capsulata CBS 1993]